MIPKKIHYCWFGGKPLPKSARKCIDSWIKFFPGYEIIEWNEKNYPIDKIGYIREAYNAQKYAFVSDYARFDILYHEGGIYFDTDVEVVRDFTDILDKGPFMGCEIDGNGSSSEEIIQVNPGLGIAAEKEMTFYKEVLDYYETQHFCNEDGVLNVETIVLKITRLLKERGLKNNQMIQNVAGITIYPKEFFNPRESNTGVLTMTKNTHSIHWYTMSWLSNKDRMKTSITRVCHQVFGVDCFERFKKGGK